MDWLSDHNAEIIYHKKVVKIPLLDGKVFSDDLSRLPPIQKIKFRELVHGSIPVAKSPYRLAPFEMEELSGQLKELQDKGFIRPSSSPWGAPTAFRTSLWDILEFTVMPFCLTNAPAKLRISDWDEDPIQDKFCDRDINNNRFLRHESLKVMDSSDPSKIEGGIENAFQTLKDKLCNAPALALPDGLEDFVSRKERVKPKRVRVMNMTLQPSIKDRILAAQKEASDESAELQRGLDEMIDHRSDRVLYYLD
ncbi:hypothetical protein Tco_1225784 [Tanacetum coccineum]